MKFEENTVRKLETAFAMGCSITEACLFADISRETYYAWTKENKELSDKFEKLKETPILKARATVVKNLNMPDTAKWYLERKKKDEFSQKTETEFATKDDKPIFIIKEGGERNNTTPKTVDSIQQQ